MDGPRAVTDWLTLVVFGVSCCTSSEESLFFFGRALPVGARVPGYSTVVHGSNRVASTRLGSTKDRGRRRVPQPNVHATDVHGLLSLLGP